MHIGPTLSVCLDSSSFFSHLISGSLGFLVSFSFSAKSKLESEHLLWASLKGMIFFFNQNNRSRLVRQEKYFTFSTLGDWKPDVFTIWLCRLFHVCLDLAALLALIILQIITNALRMFPYLYFPCTL